jgi:hypothetical protein
MITVPPWPRKQPLPQPKAIIPLTVREILDEQIAKKLA